MNAWVAIGWDGRPRPWTLSATRKEAIQAATETMMGAREYEDLGNRSDRWNYCYRRGCRIVRATVTIDLPRKSHDN